jgi:uncharacterized SAM-binding protein YcdF (DUF218 family)
MFSLARKIVFRTVLVCVLLAIILLAVVIYYPEKILCVDSGKGTTAEVIVVLGGGSHERPERAAELFKARAAPRILISGEGDDEINRQLLINAGVPASAIEVEGKSKTTKENAELSVGKLRAEKIRSAIIVTSWYHSRRALKTFEHYAPELKFFSRPSYFAFDSDEWTKSGIRKKMRLEFLKLPGYWVRYGVCPF